MASSLHFPVPMSDTNFQGRPSSTDCWVRVCRLPWNRGGVGEWQLWQLGLSDFFRETLKIQWFMTISHLKGLFWGVAQFSDTSHIFLRSLSCTLGIKSETCRNMNSFWTSKEVTNMLMLELLTYLLEQSHLPLGIATFFGASKRTSIKIVVPRNVGHFCRLRGYAVTHFASVDSSHFDGLNTITRR